MFDPVRYSRTHFCRGVVAAVVVDALAPSFAVSGAGEVVQAASGS